MDRRIIETADGSRTIAIEETNVTYHSKHGAMQESMHVFIEAGLRYQIGRSQQPDPINIFEMGFGTGLNAFLTSIEASVKKLKVYYVAVEQFPITLEEVQFLNYANTLKHKENFFALHDAPWNEEVSINENFILKKEKTDLLHFATNEFFHLIYFDAFAPSVQPELWTDEGFKKIYSMLLPNGILVTYCSKSVVRRALERAGFIVEKIPGPPGKREIVRAAASRLSGWRGHQRIKPHCLK